MTKLRFRWDRANEQRFGCLDEGFEVTDISDDLKDDQHTHEVAHQHHVSTHDDIDNVDDEDGEGAISGDLTPNDIFGLDPLDVLTLEELAEYLKVSPAAAHRVIKELKLPGRNIGGEWRFLRDAVANWLRGQEAPAQQQQKPPAPPAPPEEPAERFSRPPQRPYQADQGGGGGEYRPRQRFPEGGQQYGNQGGGQYGNRGGQYGGGGGGQYGGGEQGGGNYGGSAGGYSPPPRRPLRAAEGGGQGQFGGAAEGGGGYRGGNAGGTRFGGGGYSAGGGGGYAGGGQRFGDGSKRKNKRQVFDNERGKRLDRRREGEGVEGDVDE